LTNTAFEELLKSEVLMIKILSEDYEETFVLKDELEVVKGEAVTITKPARFFIDNIECLTNPNFD